MIETKIGIELDSVSYSEDSRTYTFDYDEETTAASMAVVAALSEVEETNPTMVEPLHTSVDTDALDAFVRSRSPESNTVHVTWTHGDHVITIHGGGTVDIAPTGVDWDRER